MAHVQESVIAPSQMRLARSVTSDSFEDPKEEPSRSNVNMSRFAKVFICCEPVVSNEGERSAPNCLLHYKRLTKTANEFRSTCTSDRV